MILVQTYFLYLSMKAWACLAKSVPGIEVDHHLPVLQGLGRVGRVLAGEPDAHVQAASAPWCCRWPAPCCPLRWPWSRRPCSSRPWPGRCGRWCSWLSRASACGVPGDGLGIAAGVVVQVAQLDPRRNVLGVRLGGACRVLTRAVSRATPAGGAAGASAGRRLAQGAAARHHHDHDDHQQRQPQADQRLAGWPRLLCPRPAGRRRVCACLPCSFLCLLSRVISGMAARGARPCRTDGRLSGCP